MSDVVAENERLLNAVSGLLEGVSNLSVVPCSDGTVGVIVRPLDCGALDDV
jgi:hypothetical protein